MKTLVTIFVLGMISLQSFAQEIQDTPAVELGDVLITAVNTHYLNKVQDVYTPGEVALLQNQVAHYNVRANSRFSEDVKTDNFEVVFGNTKGSINAFFNNQGKLYSAFERFRNILLPRSIQKELYQNHPGWQMTSNLYKCVYMGENLIDRSFKIELVKGDTKKSIVFNTLK